MAKRLLKNLTEDYLVCRICLDKYTDPRRLPCEHVFCRQCLQRHITEKTLYSENQCLFPCPICRKEVGPPPRNSSPDDWSEYFPADSLTESLLTTVSSFERETPLKSQTSSSTCQLHDGKQLEVYCMSHRILICWECAGREHRVDSCECLSTDEAVAKLRPEIDEMKIRLRSEVALAERISRTDKEFSDSRNQTLLEINNLDRKLELFWEKTRSQISILRDEVEQIYGSQLNERRQFYVVAQSLLDSECQLECLCENNSPAEILLTLPLLQEQVEENNIIIDTMMKANRPIEIVMNVDRTFNDFLSNFSALGHVDAKVIQRHEEDVIGAARENNVLSSVTESIGHILHRSQPAEQLPSAPECSRVIGNIKFCARLPDEDTCSLQGITAFSDHSAGELYVLDLDNGTLKKFNMVGDLQDQIALSGAPHGLTAVTNQKFIAVTQPDKSIISFISTSSKLKVRKCVKTMKSYNGISYLKPTAFVVTSCSRSCVDIIDHNGTPIKTFERDTETRHRLFRRPDHVCVTSDGSIVVCEANDKIICIGRDGKMKWTTRSSGQVSGLTIDRNDAIYACLRNKNSVVMMKPGGELDSARFLTSEDGLNSPSGAFVWGPYIVVICRAGDMFVFEFQ